MFTNSHTCPRVHTWLLTINYQTISRIIYYMHHAGPHINQYQHCFLPVAHRLCYLLTIFWSIVIPNFPYLFSCKGGVNVSERNRHEKGLGTKLLHV